MEQMRSVGISIQIVLHGCQTVSMEKQFLMMDTILYLYKQARTLVTMGHPMSVLKSENIFDRIISIKYDVPNDRLELFAQYHRDIDAFYQRVIEKNA